MRYEDASQISTDVTARDDTEHLAGNDFGPATGNLITGTGTVSGATGTDSGGSITAIAGAGGSDDSFDSNGMLEVAGQYGTLTIDAQGNYTYVRTPGSPEGVSDTFTYTLANEAGATDTAQLVIAIGDLPILQAQGTQTILQNGNVVVLPPGVELSDVRVVGRDLVITLPDGSTMVIPDGAVFVPQLVVNGVEVPASNLAALLIDAEPRPAAGDATPAQQSSGGNFGLPPGPLDPGVPLGDLLPPTELDYTPPEVDELFDVFDNDPPVISPSSVNVSDEGVSTVDVPIPDNSGSPDTTNERIVNGHINVVDPDGDPVVITLGEPTNALTSQGDPIDWSVSADGHTVIGTAGGIEVIRIVIEDDGDYTVTQSRPIDHPNGSIEDGVSFVIPVFATDGEDFAVPSAITVTIEDDSPVVENVTVRGGITLDESDADPRTPEGFPISGSTDGPIIVNDDGGFGADGEAADGAIVYGLGLTGGVTSLASGIQTAIGDHAITLVQVSATLIEGQYTDGGTQVAFEIEMNPDGSVTLTQNVPLEHLVDGPPGPDHDDSLDLDGLVNATVTYTDFDGDSDTGSAPIGGNLIFKDDGPNAEANEQAEPDTVILDETRDEGTDTDDGDPVASPPPGLASDTIDFSDNFFDPDFGADGEGSVTYKLLLSGVDVGSGLFALEAGDTDPGVDPGSDEDGYGQGEEIVLNISPDGLTITGTAGGTTYFTITIDPDTGVATFAQENPIWHPIIGDFDDQVTLTTELASDIQVQQTVTDSDGDFDTATVDIGQEVFSIQDDGPDPYDPCPEEVISVNDPDADPFTGSLNLPDVGEDEPGVVTFGVQDGDPVLDTGDNPVTSGDDPLFYFVNGNVLEARVGDETGELIFTITLNGDGTFTYDQIGTIGIGDTITFNNLTSTDAGNNEFAGVGANNAATTVDLLLSAEKDGSSDTINTDSDSIGSQNQSMDAGETVRIDFVENLTSPSGTPSGFSYGAHVSSTTFLGLIPQVQGDQDQTVAFTIWALDSTNTDAAEPDRDPTGGFSDSTITTITEVTVKDYLTGETHTEAVAFTDGTTFETLDFGISVRVNADGSVTFSGIQQGDSYGFSTGAGEFNAVAVAAESAGTGGSTQDSFDLGIFSIGVANDFEPVDLQVPIVLTDADGDAVQCDIDIHIGEPLVVADEVVTVNEAGLPIGSDPLSDSEIQSGALTPSGGTGPYTFALVGDDGDGILDGAFGTIELNPDGTFTYTLTDPFDTTPDADDGTNPELGKDSFDVLVTDSLGATHTATITVNIIDDVPAANADTDSVAEGGVADGNVVTGSGGSDANGTDGVADEDGADGFAASPTGVVTGIASVNQATSDTTADGAGNFVLAGEWGTLTLNRDGSYSYQSTADAITGDEVDVFEYTIVDADGDTSTTTLTINLSDVTLEADNDTQTVYEAALDTTETGDDVAAGSVTGSDPTSTGETVTGQLNVTGATNYAIVGSLVGTYGTLELNSDGSYTYTLTDPVDNLPHADDGNDTEAAGDVFTYEADDGNGNTVQGTITIDIVDDVPTAAINETGEGVSSDETDGNQLDSNDVTGPLTVFDSVADKGVDPDMAGPQFATNTSAVVNSTGTVLGADGGTTAFSLTTSDPLNPLGVDSGLNVTSGESIMLFVEGDLVVGRVDGGTFDGQAAFALSIDSDGEISMVQYLSIEHTNTGSLDESASITDGALLAVVTATDGDGDVDTASTPIGNRISFQDDGPTTYEPEDGSVPNVAGNDIHFDLDDAPGNDDIGDNFGADGPGFVRFPSSLDETDSGETSGGVKIWYFLNGDQTILEARTGATVEAAAAGPIIFTVTIDQANDRYTVNMNATVDNLGEVIFDEANFDFVGGNETWFGIVPNLQGPDDTPVDDESHDLLITPINGDTVNTSGILGGIETGQAVDAGEGFRIDYVIDLTGEPLGGGADYTPGADNGHLLNVEAGDVPSHYTTNGAFFTIRSADSTDILVKAFNDTDNDNVVGDGTQEAITKIVIRYTDDDGQTHTSADLIPTGTEQFVTLDDGGPDEITFSYQLDADNMSVIITNIQGNVGSNETPNTTVSVFTADGYQSLEVYHHGGDDFKFAGFGIQDQLLEPVEISLPTEIVDGDGDVVAGGDIDLTLTPPVAETLLASTALENQEAFNSGETSSFSLLSSNDTQQLEKTAANSNNVVLAAAIGAAGFAATGAAAHTPHFDVGGDFATNALVGKQAFADFGGTEIGGGKFADLSSFIESGGFEFGAMAMASTSHQAMAASHIGELTTSFSLGSGPNALLEATDFGGMLQMPAPAMGMDVAMVSADALMPQVAGVNAQTTGAVEQILADALQGGGSAPDIDALLNALPGGANVGLQNLATQAGDHVPAWDMGHGGVFTFDVASIITMEAMVLHHDAVQPVANG